MSEPNDDLERKLARLAAATTDLPVRPGFELRVMAAIAAENGSEALAWLDGVVRSGRVVLAVAAVIAGVGLGLAAESERAFEREAAVGYLALEVMW